MPMPQKARPEPMTKADLEAAFGKLTSEIEKRVTKEEFSSAFSKLSSEIEQRATKADLSTAVSRLALEIDKRASKDDMDSGFARMDAKFDKIFGVLDRVTGELLDNRESRTVFGAMLGDHRRTLASHDQRLTSLESRLPPTTP